MSWAPSPPHAARLVHGSEQPEYRFAVHCARRRLFTQHSGTRFYSALPIISPYPDFLSDYRSYVFGNVTAQSISGGNVDDRRYGGTDPLVCPAREFRRLVRAETTVLCRAA